MRPLLGRLKSLVDGGREPQVGTQKVAEKNQRLMKPWGRLKEKDQELVRLRAVLAKVQR